jgi:hypothetical protein
VSHRFVVSKVGSVGKVHQGITATHDPDVGARHVCSLQRKNRYSESVQYIHAVIPKPAEYKNCDLVILSH